MISQTISYQHQGVTFSGEYYAPEEVSAQNCGVVLFHERTGPGPYMERHAKHLVSLGYPVLTADMYGEGLRPYVDEVAHQVSTTLLEDRSLMRQRAKAGVRSLMELTGQSENQIFALGFSFGGCVALELARSGITLAGAISVYGYLNTPFPEDNRQVRSPLLVIHGGCDPVVWNPDLLDFLDDCARFGLDCQFKVFAAAGHGFCNRALPETSVEENCYSSRYERMSLEEIELFLRRNC